MKKTIAKVTTADKHIALIISERRWKLTMFNKYWVQIHSVHDRSIIIYAKPFGKEQEAKDHALTWTFKKDVIQAYANHIL